jgi:hypothetical protein
MVKIIRSITSTPSALEMLCTEFQENHWMDVNADCSEKKLVQCALGKIELDSTNFQLFLPMLRDSSLKTVADVVEQKMRDCGK